MSYKKAIHDVLVQAGDAGEFTETLYTVARPSLLTEGDPISPASVEANEVRGAFAIDSRYGREFRQERAGWAWVLTLRFDTEANLEAFEESLMRSPLVIPRDPSSGVDRQVRMILEDSEYQHPPRGGASNGTKAAYRFVADVCPQ